MFRKVLPNVFLLGTHSVKIKCENEGEDVVYRSMVVIYPLSEARVDVLEQLVYKNGRETRHHDEKRHQINIPQLELAVTTGREIDAGNIEDGHYLDDFGPLDARVLW